MLENVGRKITLIAILCLVSLGLLFLKDEPFTLGLDLKGGTRLVYSVDFDEAREQGLIGEQEDPAAVLDQMIDIIRNRVDPTGTLEATIRRVGTSRIQIELPGTLGLPTVEADSVLAEPIELTEEGALVLENAEAFPRSGVVSIGDEEIRYDGRERNRLLIARRNVGGVPAAHAAGDRVDLVKDDAFKAAIESLGQLSFSIVAQSQNMPAGTDLPAEQEKLRTWLEANEGAPPTAFNRLSPEEGGPHPDIEWYPLRPQSEAEEEARRTTVERMTPVFRPKTEDEKFTGGDLDKVFYTADSVGFPAVGFEMRPSRRSDFGDFTEENENRPMAIVLNDEIVSAPTIEGRLSGSSIIRGRFTDQEVTDLVTVLRSGSLTVKPQLESDERVGATLGDDYVRRGFLSGVVALGLVLAFMAFYYRRLGIYAAVSLAVSFFLLMGGLSFLDATLTLPGIAGLILTIGMAVDANILIFDRIREEMDKGRNAKQAAKNGFDLALSAILDANITTFLTAVILYNVGTGPVRGFAVTLMVGIVASVFAALVVTRVLVHFALVKGVKSFAVGQWMVKANYSFIGKAKPAWAVSVVLVLLGLIGFIVTPQAKKLGIDFLGGAEVQVYTAQAEDVETIRQRVLAIPGAIGASAEVTPILESGSDGGYSKFRITCKQAGGPEAAEDGASVAADADVRPILTESLKDLLLENPIQVAVTPSGASANVDLLLHFKEAHPPADIAAQLEEAGVHDADVTTPERTGVYEATGTAALLSENELKSAVERAFQGRSDSTGTEYAMAGAIDSYYQVGPQVVGELRDKALLALAVSLFIIVLYIRVRFAEYSYGFAAVAAVAHDVLITLGALTAANLLGILNGEINLPMIAAFLTIIGYSLNDTIVIFDRVRENLPRMKVPLAEVLDTSINQTLSRTVLTSFTTFLAVAVLYVFNFRTGNVLETFSFAMMVGILTGTYSTIFIANPMLLWLEQRGGRVRAGGGGTSDKGKKDKKVGESEAAPAGA